MNWYRPDGCEFTMTKVKLGLSGSSGSWASMTPTTLPDIPPSLMLNSGGVTTGASSLTSSMVTVTCKWSNNDWEVELEKVSLPNEERIPNAMVWMTQSYATQIETRELNSNRNSIWNTTNFFQFVVYILLSSSSWGRIFFPYKFLQSFRNISKLEINKCAIGAIQDWQFPLFSKSNQFPE